MKIIELFHLKPQKGEVGIEIEMEGKHLHEKGYAGIPNWRCEKDGSLRGESCEYVLSKPVDRDKVIEELATLQQAFEDNGSKLMPSDRCGVHVHVNCQSLEEKQVVNFIALYLIVEELMVKYCGEDREGNLFCLRAKDAEYIVSFLHELLSFKRPFVGYLREDMRYSSINLSALAKYGSLEFRSLRTSPHIGEIATWVEMILELKDSSLAYNSLADMVESMSHMGASQFLRAVMPTKAELLICSGMDKMLMNGVRRIQDLAYADKLSGTGKLAYTYGKPDCLAYYNRQQHKKKINPGNKPKKSRDIYMFKHGAAHAANQFHHPADQYFWDARSGTWVNHKPLPLNEDEKEFYNEAALAVKKEWEAYDAWKQEQRIKKVKDLIEPFNNAFDDQPPVPEPVEFEEEF